MNWIYIGYLNAIIFAFLSVQFVIPVAFLLFLAIVPVIFALQIYLTNWSISTISGVVIVLLSFLILGIDVGLWSIVYAAIGYALGITWRLGLPGFARKIATSVVATSSLISIVFLLAWIVQLDLLEVEKYVRRMSIYEDLPLFSLFVLSLIILGLTLAFVSDWLFGNVMGQIGKLPT